MGAETVTKHVYDRSRGEGAWALIVISDRYVPRIGCQSREYVYKCILCLRFSETSVLRSIPWVASSVSPGHAAVSGFFLPFVSTQMLRYAFSVLPDS